MSTKRRVSMAGLAVAALVGVAAVAWVPASGRPEPIQPGPDNKPVAPAQTAVAWVDANAAVLERTSDAIWEFAELGFQEHRSSKLLADQLEKAGFTVRRGLAGMKTAFLAEFGTGHPAVAFLAEYDALPGLSQKAVPSREPREPGGPGHACGHNLLGTGSLGAALAVKEALVRHRLPGKVVIYGTPAEEGGSGKVYLVRDGLFKGVDAVITWHPDTVNCAQAGGTLAVVRARFRFYGQAAHAALEPEKGRSALDAAELMNVGGNYLREHLPSSVRLHHVVTRGGDRPNIVPAEAENWYYVRAPRMAEAAEAFQRLDEVGQGACRMTRTRMEILARTGASELLPNRPLADLVQRHLERVGAPPFDPADERFARELCRNLQLPAGPEAAVLEKRISPVATELRQSSTDVGDVSWVVPTVELRVAAGAAGTAQHTWAFAATAGSPIGHKACRTAAKVMACAALELLTSPDQLEAARKAFADQTKGASYVCPLPPGAEPPARLDP